MYQELELPSENIGTMNKFKANWATLATYKTWFQERDAKGLPPWTNRSFVPSAGSELKSSHTVRQWCDDYCASNKLLKEFVYTKVALLSIFSASKLTMWMR